MEDIDGRFNNRRLFRKRGANWFAILKLRETGAGEEVNNVVVPGPKLIDSTRRGETEINYPLSGSVCSDETLAV